MSGVGRPAWVLPPSPVVHQLWSLQGAPFNTAFITLTGTAFPACFLEVIQGKRTWSSKLEKLSLTRKTIDHCQQADYHSIYLTRRTLMGSAKNLTMCDPFLRDNMPENRALFLIDGPNFIKILSSVIGNASILTTYGLRKIWLWAVQSLALSCSLRRLIQML